MSKSVDQTQSTKLVIGPARFSYLNALEPRIPEGSTKPKYSVALLVPKTDKSLVKIITTAIEAAIVIGITKCKKWNGKKPPANKFLNPLQDGDEKYAEDSKKYAAYKGMWFVNAKSDNKPEIVDVKLQPIIDAKEIYSGMWGRASCNMYPYDNMSMGVGCGLNNLQKLRDDENLGNSGTKAEDDFNDDFVFEEPAVDSDLD
jgi:hypothetical protein